MSFSSSGPNNKNNNNDDDMTAMIDKEEADLDDDHRRLLVAARPLLKSRNAGVVLAVCALQYYCGVSSVPIRKSLGKALVRIHYGRDAGETQYVVYASIRRLVRRCPSAFSPYLHDFFVLQMDPPQTRAAKLDILTSLALDPPSIETVLTELRQYLQWWHPQDDDEQEVEFVVAAVAAVGRVAELAQICYGRQGRGSEANVIVLNCLFGLVTVSLVIQDSRIVGQAVVVMYRILKLLQPGSNIVPDPNRVRAAATQRITLLLYNTLTRLCEVSESEGNEDDDEDDSDDDDDDDDQADVLKKWANTTIVLPPSASAAAMHWMAEILVVDSNNNSHDCVLQNHLTIRREMARLLTRSFLDLEEVEKEQAMYFAFRLLQNADSSETERRLSERILGLGRVDASPNIRDRARTFSNWAHVSVGLQFDREAFDEPSFPSRIDKERMKTSSQGRTCYPSYLPFEKEDDYRFGSLSSLMGHKAHESYRPLPDWAAENSPASLREEPPPNVNGNAKDMLYRNEETSTDSSESQEYEDGSSSEDDEGDSSSESDSEESFSDDDTDSDSSNDESGAGVKPNNGIAPSEGILLSPLVAGNSSFGTLVDLSKGSGSENQSGKLLSFHPQAGIGVNSAASIINDLRGIVLEPSPASADEEPNGSRDFGEWFSIVRPEHSGGLSVRARYVRGQTKSRHAASIGLLAGSPSLVCMEFLFDNMKGVTPFRHVRIVQRMATATSSTIGPARVVAPPELPAVGVGENAKVVVSINFTGSSDRDGTLLAKLEVKFGSGGIPFEVRPSICDLLLPCTRTVAEFDGSIEKMHGFNRLETKVASTLSPQEVTSKLLSSSSLTPVKQSNVEGEKRTRLVGSLPASSDLVYVQLEQIGADYKMIICCVHALVLSPLLNQLKKALTSQPDH
jgi:AP-3 complex subunit beta